MRSSSISNIRMHSSNSSSRWVNVATDPGQMDRTLSGSQIVNALSMIGGALPAKIPIDHSRRRKTWNAKPGTRFFGQKSFRQAAKNPPREEEPTPNCGDACPHANGRRVCFHEEDKERRTQNREG